MPAVELVTREYGGQVIIELSGELDNPAAAVLGAVLSATMACRPRIDVDLTPRRPWDSPGANTPQPFWTITWTLGRLP